jgi:tRNA(Ile)-lysidine synthase
LLNLFRGASPGGIAAMRKISVHRVGKTRLTILRPLLGVWRSEIDSYIEQQGLKFCEDKTNREVGSSRNRIRHRILPYINKTFGREVSKAIWRAAAIWVEEESFLDSMTPVVGPGLNVIELRKLAVPLQRRAIVGWLRLNRVPNAGFDLVENVRSMMEQSSLTSKINIPGDRHIRRRAKTIFIEG